MKKIILFGLLTLSLTGCFWDERNTEHLIADFNLGWYGESKYQRLFKNSDKNEYGGQIIISETVFALGFDDNFIIAKQHPNNDDTISWNNLNEHETWKLDSIPSDTLGDQHYYVKINGEWHGISNGRNTHQSLFPDKKITNYFIIDIRNYDRQKWSYLEKVYELKTLSEFNKMRKKLGVSNDLTFTLIDKDLE